MRFFSRLAATGILLAVSLFAIAAGEPAVEKPGALEVCRDLSHIAREVMQYRQKDRPMSEALSKVIGRIENWAKRIGVEMTTQEAEEMAAPMVMQAYMVSISTPPFQPEAITEFENEVFRGCYEEWTSDSEE